MLCLQTVTAPTAEPLADLINTRGKQRWNRPINVAKSIQKAYLTMSSNWMSQQGGAKYRIWCKCVTLWKPANASRQLVGPLNWVHLINWSSESVSACIMSLMNLIFSSPFKFFAHTCQTSCTQLPGPRTAHCSITDGALQPLIVASLWRSC